MRSTPSWLIAEPCIDVDLGVIKSGKEAQVHLFERTAIATPERPDIATFQFARKRYLPREVKHKGQLQELGFQRSSAFVNDVQYREGRQFRKSRDRRAVERMSTYGRHLLQDRWTGHEHEVMTRLWRAGMQVPFPIAYGDDVFDLEYIGDASQAAPQLQAARLTNSELDDAFDDVVKGLRILVGEGLTHVDLSAYNLLWWQDRVWFIDFPQAIDIAANLQGLDFLHRDVVNVCNWFQRKGLDVDEEELFADLLTEL
jgi:RIO kinase 1